MPGYFDIHSHLDFANFDQDRGEVIEEMRQKSIWTINVGVDIETSKKSLELADSYAHIFACVGQHPTDANIPFDSKDYEDFMKNENVVAIGECGLDYFRGGKLGEQEADFREQIKFAERYNKPLMIHARPSGGSMDAYDDVLSILSEYENTTGNVHFFVGDKNIAKKFLDKGFSMSFDGPVTFADDYNEVIKYIPIDSLMVETDSPFATPEPHRGSRNNPTFVSYIIDAIASVRGEDTDFVRISTVENAMKLFNIAP